MTEFDPDNKKPKETSASVQKKKLDERPIEPFDAGYLIDAVRTGALPPCTIILRQADFVALLSRVTLDRCRLEVRATSPSDFSMEPALGLVTLHGANGPVIVKTEPLVELKGHTWSKAQEEEVNPTPVAADDIPCERIEYPLTRINPFTGCLVSYRTRKNTPFEEANPTPVAADDIPCEPIEAELVGGEPSASITKRQLDEKPVPPICTCGGRACGTTCATWCDTQRRG